MLVIEHHLDVIKTADYIIDLGPLRRRPRRRAGGEGTPEEVAADRNSFTGQYLRPILEAAGTMAEDRAPKAKRDTAAKRVGVATPVNGKRVVKDAPAVAPPETPEVVPAVASRNGRRAEEPEVAAARVGGGDGNADSA